MDLTGAFFEGVSGCEEFTESLDIMKKNSNGNLFLIGGFVYKTLAHVLYSTKKPRIDLDYLVDDPAAAQDLPKGWRIVKNRFRYPRFTNGQKRIDFTPLGYVPSIKLRHLAPTIENYLTGVPLTVQSIAFDVYMEKIIGDVGIDAVEKRVVAVNNLDFARRCVDKKEISLERYIADKAESLGFTPVFP